MMFGVVGGRAYNHFTWISGYIVSQKKGLLGSSTTNSCLEMVWYWPHKSDINELVYLAPSSIQTLITNHVGHPHVLSSLHSSSRKFACTVACSASVKGCRASSSVSFLLELFLELGVPIFSFKNWGIQRPLHLFASNTQPFKKNKKNGIRRLGLFPAEVAWVSPETSSYLSRPSSSILTRQPLLSQGGARLAGRKAKQEGSMEVQRYPSQGDLRPVRFRTSPLKKKPFFSEFLWDSDTQKKLVDLFPKMDFPNMAKSWSITDIVCTSRSDPYKSM